METMPLSAPATVSALGDVVLLARVFAGMSEPARLQILLLLLDSECNVSELVSRTGISQGRVSMHLQCLRHCGFVASERRGKFVYYRVRDGRVRELIQRAQELAADYTAELASCGVLNDETKYRED
ncbi:MAG: metalloregulator ArsR/SmtB family transcription factor [Roseiflexaceae bacterium]